MGISLGHSLTADLSLYRPRHAAPPRPVTTVRSLRARLGRAVAIAGLHVTDIGARLQLAAGARHGRAWA